MVVPRHAETKLGDRACYMLAKYHDLKVLACVYNGYGLNF